MRLPLERRREGLDDGEHAVPGVGLVDGGRHHLAVGVVGESCHLTEELSVAQEIGPKHLGNGKTLLGVGDVGEELALE